MNTIFISCSCFLVSKFT